MIGDIVSFTPFRQIRGTSLTHHQEQNQLLICSDRLSQNQNQELLETITSREHPHHDSTMQYLVALGEVFIGSTDKICTINQWLTARTSPCLFVSHRR